MSNKRKPTFFTSDLHIGHRNVIDFSNRPFRDCEHMHQVLINNYNAIVPDNEICYFLGDVGLCDNDIIKPVIDKLNGTKVLIIGNHDKKMNAMYGLGFDVVVNMMRMTIAGEQVTMTHCPLLGVYRENTEGMRGGVIGDNWHGESNPRRRSLTCENKGQFHCHGHIHSPNSGKSKRILGRQMDVGVDANNYRPVSISQIESWISKTKELENANK